MYFIVCRMEFYLTDWPSTWNTYQAMYRYYTKTWVQKLMMSNYVNSKNTQFCNLAILLDVVICVGTVGKTILLQ